MNIEPTNILRNRLKTELGKLDAANQLQFNRMYALYPVPGVTPTAQTIDRITDEELKSALWLTQSLKEQCWRSLRENKNIN